MRKGFPRLQWKNNFKNTSMEPEINDFVTNSDDEWWDSSREKSWVPVQNQWVLVQKTTSPKLKMIWPSCNQTVNLNKDSKALYYRILKFKYGLSISKHKKCSMKYASLNNSHNNCHSNYTNRLFLQNNCSDRLIDLCLLRDACHGLFCVFGDFYAPGTQDAEVTKSLVGNAFVL